MEFEQEITTKVRADFAQIKSMNPKGSSMIFIKPYVSGSVMNIAEQMSKKHGKSYHFFLVLVEPIAERLMKEYFG